MFQSSEECYMPPEPTPEESFEDIEAAYAQLTEEARIERESEHERYVADMCELPPWPTDAEVQQYEAEMRLRYAA